MTPIPRMSISARAVWSFLQPLTPIIGIYLYFSFVVGMTFQVSDVQIEDHDLRRVVLANGVLAFFFSVVIVALTINIVAGTDISTNVERGAAASH